MEDRSRYNTLSEWNKFHKLNVPVTVIAHQWFGYGRMKTLKLIVSDSEGVRGELICFNRPFWRRHFPKVRRRWYTVLLPLNTALSNRVLLILKKRYGGASHLAGISADAGANADKAAQAHRTGA